MLSYICWIENTLVKDKTFSLPGCKALTKSDNAYKVILIGTTEISIECLKKDKKIFTQARKKDAQSKVKL